MRALGFRGGGGCPLLAPPRFALWALVFFLGRGFGFLCVGGPWLAWGLHVVVSFADSCLRPPVEGATTTEASYVHERNFRGA